MNLEALYDWGISVIAAVQQMKSPFMTAFMRGISFFGDPMFYLLAVAIVFWCVDSHKGFKLGAVIIFSGALNAAIKQTLQVPRPFQRDPAVFILEESGFSTPSGHSQGSASFYPVASCALLGGESRSRRLLRAAVAILVPLLVGFSRIYLGVHYPTDVLLGLATGFITATGVLLFWNDVARLVAQMRKSVKLLLLALLCFMLNHFCKSDTSMPGLLLGFMGGYIFLSEQGGFNAASGTMKQKILRFLIGVAVVGAVYFLLKTIFAFAGLNATESKWYALCRFVRYCATGAAASYLVPALFVRMNLAPTLGTDDTPHACQNDISAAKGKQE